MNRYLVVLLVALCGLSIIDASDVSCPLMDFAKEGLDRVKREPEAFVNAVIERASRSVDHTSGIGEFLKTLFAPVTALLKGVITVIDSIGSFRFPNGENIFDVLENSVVYALDLFVGNNKTAIASWTTMVEFIFTIVRNLYNEVIPVLFKVIDGLLP